MSIINGNSVSAQDFINLKARVKAEMSRRNGSGDLTSYASTTNDFTEIPKKNNTPKIEHFSKIRDIMSVINPAKVGVGAKKKSDTVENLTVLEANMTTFEAQPRSARSNNDCASACSGMCVSTCSTGCSGCDGCSGCGGACSTNCSSQCANSCDNTCDSGCYSCAAACSGSCSGSCSGGCTDICTGCSNCTGTCVYFCAGGANQ